MLKSHADHQLEKRVELGNLYFLKHVLEYVDQYSAKMINEGNLSSLYSNLHIQSVDFVGN